MTAHLRSHLCLLLGTFVLCCGVYPLAVWTFAQTVAPGTANGSLVLGADGKPVGSSLIAQEFTGDGYFQPRPSAAGFNASASSGSNFAANNPKFRERVEEQLKQKFAGVSDAPADAVTASGSGLDPHLTLAAAKVQVPRVSAARKLPTADVEGVLTKQSFTPLAGLAGEPLVNVLEVNRALDRVASGGK